MGIKKNGRKFRRNGLKGGYTVASDNYEYWASDAAWAIKSAMRGMDPISIPVNAKMIFYFKNRSGEPDLSNAYQGPEDLLQEMGVLANDRLIMSHDGSRKRFGERPRVEITITPFKD